MWLVSSAHIRPDVVGVRFPLLEDPARYQSSILKVRRTLLNKFPNLVPRLTPEQIIEADEFYQALQLDLECIGEESSDDELIEDEKRRSGIEEMQERVRKARIEKFGK